MAKETKFDEKRGTGRPQYGKKGWNPRTLSEYKKENLDNQETNDPIFWNRVPMFNNVTKFTWPLIIGRVLDLNGIADLGRGTSYDARTYTNVHMPTFMKIDYIPGPGWAQDTSQGVNRSLAKIMSRLRSSLSTSNIGFETADLGLFMTSTASIPMCFAVAKRALRCRNLWMDRNYTVPRGILKAMGFDFDDIKDNVNKYVGMLNTMIDEYNGMNIPDFSYIYDRHYVFANNIYGDEDSELAQFYLFNPTYVYKYIDTASKSRAIHIENELNRIQDEYGVESRFAAFLNMIQNLIDAWKTSSDFFQINGVLLRALKDIPRQMVPHVTIEEQQAVVVDRAITMQIMNMTIHGDADIENLDVTQDPANPTYIKWQPKGNQDRSNTKVLLRVFEQDLSPDDNMEMTRLVNFQNPDDSTEFGLHFENCGDMIVTKATSYVINVGEESDPQIFEVTSNNIYLDLTAIASGSAAAIAMVTKLVNAIRLSNFRYMPAIHIWTTGDLANPTNAYLNYSALLGDVYQYEVYRKEDYKQLQNAAFQSIWLPKFDV